MPRITGVHMGGRHAEMAGTLQKKLSFKYQVEAVSREGASMAIAREPGRITSAHGIDQDGPPLEERASADILMAISCEDDAALREVLASISKPFALAAVASGHLLLARDVLGVAPLYLGRTQGAVCYGSELKLLHGWASDIRPMPPGTFSLDGGEPRPFADPPQPNPEEGASPDEWAALLQQALQEAVSGQAEDGCGVLLSGGLDSSAVAGFAAKAGFEVKVFTVGYPGGLDEEHAKMLAKKLGLEHHVCHPSADDLLASLPKVIAALESFDAPLVRSAVVNYQVNKMAADYVPMVLCGEGSDELFGGYDFLKDLPADDLPGALQNLLQELPGGGMLRVDRMAHAHALEPRVPFLAPDLVELAWRMPPSVKIGPGGMEKWVLRQACRGVLPDAVADRRKQKFSVGTGSSEVLAGILERRITDEEFARARKLPDESELRSREELYYYRLFSECFGPDYLTLVGRTRT